MMRSPLMLALGAATVLGATPASAGTFRRPATPHERAVIVAQAHRSVPKDCVQRVYMSRLDRRFAMFTVRADFTECDSEDGGVIVVGYKHGRWRWIVDASQGTSCFVPGIPARVLESLVLCYTR